MAIPTSAGIYLYNATNLEEQSSIPVGTPFIAFSPDSRLLATSQLNAVSLWDPATGIQKGELLGDPGDMLWEISFSPDGSLLATVTSNRQVYVWSLADGERQFTLPGDRLRFSPDGELAVTVVYGEIRFTYTKPALVPKRINGTWRMQALPQVGSCGWRMAKPSGLRIQTGT